MEPRKVKRQLSNFKVIKCDMHHEKIQVKSDSNEPIFNFQESKKTYVRNNLCPYKLRSERLGCAHSSANSNFIGLIDQLNSNDLRISELKTDVQSLINEVYKLDHEKGELEKEIHECSNERLESVEQELTTAIVKHRKMMCDLNALKTQLLSLI